MRNALLGLVIGTLSLVLSANVLAAGPAVSKMNGKIESIGGNINGESAKAAAVSLTAPLGDRFGVQLDTAFGEIGDLDVKGAGLHLFTRDPEHYLLGVNGIYAEVEELNLERYAVEGEYYFGSLTLAALVGHQSGDIDDVAFATTDIRWYPLENLMLETGGSFTDNDSNKGHVAAEYQLLNSLSVFADIAAGNDNYEHALLGARYYIGAEKTLVRRHREDDPLNNVLISAIEGMTAFNAAAAECAISTTADTYLFYFEGHALGCHVPAEVDCNGIIQSVPSVAGLVSNPNEFNGQLLSDFGPGFLSGCYPK